MSTYSRTESGDFDNFKYFLKQVIQAFVTQGILTQVKADAIKGVIDSA